MPSTFVSYAHLDNKPPFGAEHGWVTYFVENLKSNLGRRLGRKTKYDLWMDYKLKGNDELTPELEQQVANSDTLIIFLSPAWLDSKWCQRELEIFLTQQSDHNGRIFVIELEKITQEKPAALKDKLGYRFWEETHDEHMQMLGFPLPNVERDQEYFKRILNLSCDLKDTLSNINTASQNTPLEKPKATVYVAPVHDALVDARNELISELRQFEIDVLPRSNKISLGQFTKDMESDLKQCSHFIQLLDDNYNSGIPANQTLIAEDNNKPILQWREIGLDYSKANHEQKPLLDNAKAMLLTDFKRSVREQVLPKKISKQEEQEKTNNNQIIFVHTGQQDMKFAEQIAAKLEEQDYWTILPDYTGKPSEIDESIKINIKICHILLLLQKHTPPSIISNCLVDVVTQSDARENELSLLICRDKAAKKPPFNPPSTRVLQCSGAFDENCIQQFLEKVEA